MRRIERPASFKRDFKRETKGRYRTTLNKDLLPVFDALIADRLLDPRYRDHALTGVWKGYRECHIRPDLLLIYRKTDDSTLILTRLGSHSELFG